VGVAAYVIAIIDVTNAEDYLEFPSLERAHEWYESPEYRPLRPIRQANSRGRIAFFEGLEGPAG
jgi:uncharacterized protein (DUF1330 family)